jgi:hypothetical protein
VGAQDLILEEQPERLLSLFLNIRLDEPSFELTKPSTGQEYKVACDKEKRKEKKNWGYQL